MKNKNKGTAAMIQGPFKSYRGSLQSRIESETRAFCRCFVNGVALGTGVYIAISQLNPAYLQFI